MPWDLGIAGQFAGVIAIFLGARQADSGSAPDKLAAFHAWLIRPSGRQHATAAIESDRLNLPKLTHGSLAFGVAGTLAKPVSV